MIARCPVCGGHGVRSVPTINVEMARTFWGATMLRFGRLGPSELAPFTYSKSVACDVCDGKGALPANKEASHGG